MDKGKGRTKRVALRAALLCGKDRGLGMPVRTLRLPHRELFIRHADEFYYFSHTVGETDVYTSE